MAGPINQSYNAIQSNNRTGKTHINCLQINLKHSRAATSNLMHIIELHNIDIIFIQEPYVLQNKLAGISRKYRIFTKGENRIRAAIVVANKQIDAVLLNQISDEDAVVVEILHNKLKFNAVSMYMDIRADINDDFRKLDHILEVRKKEDGIILGVDSNLRSIM